MEGIVSEQMLRVIIADDEQHILRLIQALADWNDLGMEVSGVASNGLEALALIEEAAPDILITDIRMPGCGGLELIERAKALCPQLEVIIISGYAHFEYAQTAIQYGVGEYLLKPINQQSLNSTLAKMGQKCRARRETQSSVEGLRAGNDNYRTLFRERLVADLVSGSFQADGSALEKQYHFFEGSEVYQVFLVKLDYDIAQFNMQSLSILREKIEAALCPSLLNYCDDVVLQFNKVQAVGIIGYSAKNCNDIRHALRDSLNQLVAQKNLFGAVEFTIALGTGYPHFSRLPDSLKIAQTVMHERLIDGTERLLERGSQSTALQKQELLARYTQAISRAIDSMSLAAAEQAVEALERTAMGVPNASGSELFDLVIGAGTAFITQISADNREEALEAFLLNCGQCSSVSALFTYLKNVQSKMLQAVQNQIQQSSARPIRLAKEYIQQHYGEALTLEQVSEELGFSVSYFSTLFKKETGEGFVKYLARIRIQEAKTLLRETNLSVLEICRQVGYLDIKHFTRMFKQDVGINPGEYRKLYG
ncbi:MAG: response regulator [Eubacteriales bacterium]|nr:response regulator [Eubacteriales bacterium]